MTLSVYEPGRELSNQHFLRSVRVYMKYAISRYNGSVRKLLFFLLFYTRLC